jgi:hypothetical protein
VVGAHVFVLASHRGAGLGHRTVEEMIDRGPGARFRWLPHTADATLLERPGARPAVQDAPSTR